MAIFALNMSRIRKKINNMIKKCIKCRSELPLTTEFYTKYASKSNKFEPGESWHTKCKQCELEEKLKDE